MEIRKTLSSAITKLLIALGLAVFHLFLEVMDRQI